VTDCRILLATHDRDTVLLDSLFQASEALKEDRRRGYSIVHDVSFVIVKLVFLRPPAKLHAEKKVFDSRSLQGVLKFLPVEMRHIPRIRIRARIHYDLDRVARQKSHEFL
jgi:hypothetical protein